MAKKKKKKANKKSNFSLKGFFIVVFAIIVALIFTPTSAILFVGMLPTVVAFIVDRSFQKNKTFTIGAMNFAGCFPFLLMLWMTENTLQVSLKLLSDPVTIIVIYSVAGFGYVINWGVTQAVIAILVEKSHHRIKKIQQEKKVLVERWGEKVTGKYDLDQTGFPINDLAIQDAEEKKIS